MKKKLLGLLLPLALLFCALPMMASAEGYTLELNLDEVNGNIEITTDSVKYGASAMNNHVDRVELTGSTDNPVIIDGTKVNLVLNGANIIRPGSYDSDQSSAIVLKNGANVTLTLADRTENKVCGALEGCGIEVPEGCTLTIDGLGKLEASYQKTGNAAIGAAIGGTYNSPFGTITINGGDITATGSKNSIGSGNRYQSTMPEMPGKIVLNGGTVHADRIGNPDGITGAVVTGDGNCTVYCDTINANMSGYNGIVNSKDGKTKTVYGTVTITSGETFTVAADETLTIKDGATLTIADGATLVVNGNLQNNGKITGSGTLDITHGGGSQLGNIEESIKQVSNAHQWGNWKDVNGACVRTCTFESCSVEENELHDYINGKCTRCGTLIPDGIWVAETYVSGGGYWRVENNALTTDGATADNYNVWYDRDNGVLTMKDAQIQNQYVDQPAGLPSPTNTIVYAANLSEIHVIGDCVLKGQEGISVADTQTTLLQIKGTGNLDATIRTGCPVVVELDGTYNGGIHTAGNNGVSNTSITIRAKEIKGINFIPGQGGDFSLTATDGNIETKNTFVEGGTLTVSVPHGCNAILSNNINYGKIMADNYNFPAGATVTASTNADGSNPEPWDQTKDYHYVKIEMPLAAYNMTQGNGVTWQQSGDLTFAADGDPQKFTGVLVDDTALDAANYTVNADGTVVLKQAYLATLALGKHTITLTYKDGSAAGSFTTAAAPVVTPTPAPAAPTATATPAPTAAATPTATAKPVAVIPATGDSNAVAVWALAAVLSLSAMLALGITQKRQ